MLIRDGGYTEMMESNEVKRGEMRSKGFPWREEVTGYSVS
jgi:hypothetical protein